MPPAPTHLVRHLLRDKRAAAAYRAAERPMLRGGLGRPVPGTDELLRWAVLAERRDDPTRPDHVLANLRALHFREPRPPLWRILEICLKTYHNLYIRPRGREIYVDFDQFGEWQDELAGLSPLPFLAYAASGQANLRQVLDAELATKIVSENLAGFRYTALPVPYSVPVDSMIARKCLHEIHVHLNGTLELDLVWQAALARPDVFRERVKQLEASAGSGSAEKRERLTELLEQIGGPDFTFDTVCYDLREARDLRLAMALAVCRGEDSRRDANGYLCDARGGRLDQAFDFRRHPMSMLLGLDDTSVSALQAEILLQAAVFARLAQPGGDQLAVWMHEYLLILNASFLPLCVQTDDQRGFDQFQKLTYSPPREAVEKDGYTKRFDQMNRGRPGDLASLEGRFSPSDKGERLVADILSIAAGHLSHRLGTEQRAFLHSDPALWQDFSLTPHLIKRPENRVSACRFGALRKDVARRWRILEKLRRERPMVSGLVNSLDAAANELHTPPEVFAPVFRAARRAGITRFTYHVGEDFEHLVAGMRAVFEAIHFLDLQDADRIAHATAIGVDPGLWLARTPTKLALRRGDRLDDLVFVEAMWARGAMRRPPPESARVEMRRLARSIHGVHVNIDDLTEAWLLRSLDPLWFDPVDRDIWDLLPGPTAELRAIGEAKSRSPGAMQLFLEYHSPEIQKERAQIEMFETAVLDAAQLRSIQDYILREEVIRRRLVVETLPTSNVRISVYESFTEHHVLRWLGLAGDGPTPTVVVGSDDPGIFACSLRGEYMHLFRIIMKVVGNEATALRYLRQLSDNAKDYSFVLFRPN